MTRGDMSILPENFPKTGEVYRHYKWDLYEVVFLAEHNDPDELCVVYKACYENPDFPYFTRLLRSWEEDVMWEGKVVKRFQKLN